MHLEAEDVEVLAVAHEAVATVAKRQPFAEVPQRPVVVAHAASRFDSDLMRPAVINRRLAEFTFTIDHAASPLLRSGR